MLELEGVAKSFDEGAGEARTRRSVVSGLSARFAAGEKVAIVGRSGSGKTTLLNLVSGIELPDAGSIRFEGRDLTRLTDRERTLVRRRRMGFVFQFFNLVPTLTVAENVLLPLDLNGVAEPAARERVAAMLERVGLADRGRSYPDRLSGGEQQRVALARALVHAPPVVLADEPTGNLDTETGSEVLSLLESLTAQSNGLLLMVTHSAEAASRADRVLRLSDGRLVERPALVQA